MSEHTKLIAQLKQLYNVRNLYECQFKCVLAISYLLKKDIFNTDNVKNLFDCTKTCSNLSVREYFSGAIPEVSTFCLCSDFADKLKKMETNNTIVVVDPPKEDLEK